MITPLALQDSLNDFLEKEVASKFMLKAPLAADEFALKPPEVIRSGWILPKKYRHG